MLASAGIPGLGLAELLICGCFLAPIVLVGVLVAALVTRSKPRSSGQPGAPYPPAFPSAPTQPQAPAGWYADPITPGQMRYWDGAKWTEHVSTPGATTAGPGQQGE